jgi:hypothetical protein
MFYIVILHRTLTTFGFGGIMKKTVLLLVIAISGLGCSSMQTTKDYLRGTEEPFETCCMLGEKLTVDHVEKVASVQDELINRSFEIFHDPVRPADGINLGIIEIKDDGMYNQDQKDLVMKKLHEVIEANQGALIVTFVHGWHHNAAVCDGNLACFRRVLEQINRMPRINDKPVFGIYIGWRGESYKGDLAAKFTLWGRKSAAEYIGKRGARDLLIEIDDLYQYHKTVNHFVTMVTVGHSLGGVFVFKALQHRMQQEDEQDTEKYIQALIPPEKTGGVYRGIGDLVILLNPALESRDFAPFSKINKTASFPAEQSTVLVAIAGKKDSAVKYAFPIFKTLTVYPWFHGLAEVLGLGHYPGHVTHRLTYTSETNFEEQEKGSCRCGYPYQTALSFDDLKVETLGFMDQPIPLEQWTYSYMPPDEPYKEEVKGKYETKNANLPFRVVSVSGDVISDHNDIYNPILVGYIVHYVYQMYRHEEVQYQIQQMQ